jgi:hypothetical protein
MADTPAPEKPKRRRTAKSADGETKPATARKSATVSSPAAKKVAPAKAAAPRKSASATAASGEAKPKRAPRKAAAPKPEAEAVAAPKPAPTPSPARSESQAPPRAGLFAALGTLAAVGGAFFIWRASRAEEPRYQTVESDNIIEVRKYPAMVTAGTETRGERQAALNEGFRTLADYLFAKSRPGARLPMTAPVLADTDKDGSWRTRFVMPADKARAALPAAPAGVDLVSEPARRVAAIRFSGRADDATLDAKEGALRSWLQIRGLPHEGKAVHAYYNAPFLPGPFRRNEVMIVLSEEGGMGG